MQHSKSDANNNHTRLRSHRWPTGLVPTRSRLTVGPLFFQIVDSQSMHSLSYHPSGSGVASSMLGMNGMTGISPSSSAASNSTYSGMVGYANPGFTLGEGIENDVAQAQLNGNSQYRPQNEEVRAFRRGYLTKS